MVVHPVDARAVDAAHHLQQAVQVGLIVHQHINVPGGAGHVLPHAVDVSHAGAHLTDGQKEVAEVLLAIVYMNPEGVDRFIGPLLHQHGISPLGSWPCWS